MYYVYVLVSGDKTYLGYTADLKRRVKEHQTGDNTSTRGRDWELAYYEAFRSEQDAHERENKLKQRGQSKRWLYERISRSLDSE